MGESDRTTEGKVVGSATDTLSQLVARILNQLSLSAWLPSAALTLLVAFTMHLGSVLDGTKDAPPVKPPVKQWRAALSQTFTEIGHTSIGALMLLVVVIVVLTMLTQAFSFEAIRVLEGYWGTHWFTERPAQVLCNHLRRVHKRLIARDDRLHKAAWRGAKEPIKKEVRRQTKAGEAVVFTKHVRAALKVEVWGGDEVELTQEEKSLKAHADWHFFAPPELLRRRVNVQKRIGDFPESHRILPTRLGNVIRHFEDLTGRKSVETLVDEVFSTLPADLKLSHDEQRGRLDLYCAMCFVWLFAGVIAVARFGWTNRSYSLAAILIALVCARFSYRAAIASARYYGSLVVIIAQYASADRASPPLAANAVHQSRLVLLAAWLRRRILS